MKKGKIISIVCLIVLIGIVAILCIFNGNKEKTLTCSINGKVTNGTEIKNEYIITYKGKYVKELKSIETATTTDQTALKKYKESVEEMYSKNKDIEYFNYDIKLEDDTLISTVIIDYDNIDTDALIKVNPTNEELIKDGKVNINDLIKEYEKTGATCK